MSGPPPSLGLFESSSLTMLSSEVNTPHTSPGPDGEVAVVAGAAPVPSTLSIVLSGVDTKAPFEDQVARQPVFVPTNEKDLFLTADTPINKAGKCISPYDGHLASGESTRRVELRLSPPRVDDRAHPSFHPRV